ncbi:MAG TPA: sulfite exporter TauE/SafE family protein, partial [Blastocatellia bacterium]|nr:sulfite exporter TauE/SafE family protein [Blastocatellia bacterium]
MDFLISHQHINPFYLISVGFIVGILGGFFGVGGSFLAAPALFAAGVPMNFVVGTDLAHIVGKSIVATKKHRALGNVDVKLGLLMVIGTIGGVELGAQSIEYLKRQARVDVVVGTTYVVILLLISSFMAWESLTTIRMRNLKKQEAKKDGRKLKKLEPGQDETAFGHIAKRIHRISLPPVISLPESGIQRISLWAILIVAVVGGFFSGFLGGGAG